MNYEEAREIGDWWNNLNWEVKRKIYIQIKRLGWDRG
jgi:hypothetical protein